MLRHPAGRDQHDVEADIALIVVGVVGEPQLRRGDDAALGALGHRFRSLIGAVARLDLDKDEGAAAARDDVDLAKGVFQRRATMR